MSSRAPSFALWARVLADREAAGARPLFVVAGIDGVWGLWFSSSVDAPPAEIGAALEHGRAAPVPSWYRSAGGSDGSAYLDAVFVPAVLASLIDQGRIVDPPGAPSIHLWGPLQGKEPPASGSLAPLGPEEAELKEWQRWQIDHAAESPRFVLVHVRGSWRMWSSLGIRVGLDGILPMLCAQTSEERGALAPPLNPYAQLTELPHVRRDGGSFPVRELGQLELVLERQRAGRRHSSPSVFTQVPEERTPTEDRPF